MKLILMINLITIAGCSRSDVAVVSELDQITMAINNEFVSSKAALEKFGKVARQEYSDVFSKPLKSDFTLDGRYSKLRSMYYKSEDDGKCAFWSSGLSDYDSLMKFIFWGEGLEDRVISVKDSNPYISHMWLISHTANVFKYPYEDILSSLPEGLDVTVLDWWNMASREHNPGGRAVWTKEPFIGIYGGGWIMTAGYPLYYRERYEVEVTIDIAINDLEKRNLKDIDGNYLLLSNSLVLIAASDMVKSRFPIKTIDYYNFVEQLMLHPDISWEYSIKNEDQERFLNILATGIERGETKINFEYMKKKYSANVRKVESVGFYVVAII